VDAIKVYLIIPFYILFLGSAYAGSESANPSSSVIEYAHRQVVAKIAELGDRIVFCDRQRNSNPIPKVPYARLSDMGITKQQLVSAITYLSHRNYALCEGRAREALAFALGTLSSLADQQGLMIEEIKGIENHLVFPSIQEVESEIAFSKLSDDIKSILLGATGDLPFLLIPTLENNRLFSGGSE
jgi:hypothetical protein